MLRETCLLLSKTDDKKDYNDFLSLICDLFKDQIDKKKKEKENIYNHTSLIINYLLFILTLIINMKDNKKFVKLFLKKYYKILFSSIKEIKIISFNKILSDILSDLFLEEYKSIFFRNDEKDKELEELYNK